MRNILRDWVRTRRSLVGSIARLDAEVKYQAAQLQQLKEAVEDLQHIAELSMQVQPSLAGKILQLETLLPQKGLGDK